MISKTQHINISVTRLLCTLCKLDFLPNSSSDWTWEKCILLAHKELNLGSGAMRTPSGWGRVEVSLEHAEVCCQRVCCSFGSAFSFSFLKSVFLHYFSSSLFLVVNDKEKKRTWSYALRSLPFYPPQQPLEWRSYSRSCAPRSLGPSDLVPGQGNQCECLIPASPSLFS